MGAQHGRLLSLPAFLPAPLLTSLPHNWYAGILTFIFFGASLTVNLMLQARLGVRGGLASLQLYRWRSHPARMHAPPALPPSAPCSPQSLFLLLSIVFFLLAGGVVNPHAHKVGCRWQAHSGCRP